MKKIPYANTCENADKVARGELILYQHDRQSSWKLNKKELAEYEAAKVRHYAIDPSRNGYASDAYYRWCEAANVPWITIRPKKRYAVVKMDMIFVAPHYKLHQEAMHEVMLLFQTNISVSTKDGAYVSIGVYNIATSIYRDRAEYVAGRLWAIATAPRAWKMEDQVKG